LSKERLPTAWFIALKTKAGHWLAERGLSAIATRSTVLFCLALFVYLATRLVGLVDFPIFFFTDEAVQTVLAADFVRDNFQNYDKEFLPTYFSNGRTFNLSSVSVYLQVIPYLLFGKSLFITRTVSVLVTLLGATAIGLILRNIFKIPFWWSGVLLLSITPAWFYHSRTAFESAEMVSFYALFLYFYMLYRCRSPRNLYPALIFGALVFYTYSPGQVIMVVTGVVLLLSDLKYHWENRDVTRRGLVMVGLLALPYLRFHITHPTLITDQLVTRAPYWSQSIPWFEKLARYGINYLHGFSPLYWWLPHEHDLPRHVMKGYGHLHWVTLPFFLVGLVDFLRSFRSSSHRATLAALVAAPAGSALVGVGITRLLVLVIPVVILSTRGLSLFLQWLSTPAAYSERKGLRVLSRFQWRLPPALVSISLFIILSAVNFGMLRDVLVNGPTWFENYGLGGMQYGAHQVFSAVKEQLHHSPETYIILSPTWANGTDVLARFFLDDPLPIQLGSIKGHLNRRLPLDANTLFILPPDEYESAISSGKFEKVNIERVLPYPNGQPGFYFLRLNYVSDIDQILEAESVARRSLQEVEVDIGGETVLLRYSSLDIGLPEHLFDDSPYTVARTVEANPFILELTFPQARHFSGMELIVGSIEAEVTAHIYPDEIAPPLTFVGVQRGSIENPIVNLDFGYPVPAYKVWIEVEDIHQSEPGNIHIWEIRFQK
jgi:hypothetical protein